MRQLTSLDAQFLALENGRQSGHVGALAVLDPSTTASGTLEVADLRELILRRLPLLPPLRWRLVEVPLGLDYPYWVDDSRFDLEYHVRELALPSPGSDEQLSEQVARIISRPLDRARPLWELYVIQGYHDGCVAMLTKIHHALIDGMSGNEIMGLLLDLGPDGPSMPEEHGWKGAAEGTPGTVEMLARAALGIPRYPVRLLRALPRAIPNIQDTPLGNLPGAGTAGAVTRRLRGLAGGSRVTHVPARFTAPHTSFNGRISPHRRFAFGCLSLDDVKAIKNHHGYTVNDVVVSVCAGAVRRWLVEHDELPDGPLVAQIPVSVRGEDQMGTFGNRILLMSAPLFTNLEHPVERLQATHEFLKDMKQRHRALPATLLQDANNFIPPAVFARAAQLTFRLSASGLAAPNWNLVISNVPGPRIPLYCAGAKLVANYPVSVITDAMGLNITLMSYLDRIDVGIVCDRDQMPDVQNLIGWLADGVSELLPEGAGVANPEDAASAGSESSPESQAVAETSASD
jgi:WS/DGAT/MGAT family acyltransferase